MIPTAAPPTPRVTIVIVNWNKRDYVIKLLDSLQVIIYPNYEVVLIDNASTDGSVEAIKEHPLPLTLLVNSENLGGTGGFNTGLRYAVEKLTQDYIWMLDNDAEVLPETLIGLVQVMEADRTIGLAGSCIMSPEDRTLIVEAGAFVGWPTGTSVSNLRYCRADSYRGDRVFDVDSVAACSALARDAVVREIGVMDDRFFLHWDDIDYCVRIRKAGHRVVVAMDSPVYHVAEKGYYPAISYYNFRNSLLFQAKHHHKVGKFFSASNTIAGRYLSLAWYLLFLGHRKASVYIFSGLGDFLGSRFGKSRMPSNDFAMTSKYEDIELRREAERWQSVVIFAVGSFESVVAAVERVKEISPSLAITIAVSSDRAAIYLLPQVNHLISYDILSSGYAGKLKTAWSVLRGRFDCGITAGSALPLPYAFLLPKNLYFSLEENSFYTCHGSRYSFWKVPLAILAGKLSAFALAIPILLVARKLKNRNARS